MIAFVCFWRILGMRVDLSTSHLGLYPWLVWVKLMVILKVSTYNDYSWRWTNGLQHKGKQEETFTWTLRRQNEDCSAMLKYDWTFFPFAVLPGIEVTTPTTRIAVMHVLVVEVAMTVVTRAGLKGTKIGRPANGEAMTTTWRRPSNSSMRQMELYVVFDVNWPLSSSTVWAFAL